jgi:hypothetical protein
MLAAIHEADTCERTCSVAHGGGRRRTISRPVDSLDPAHVPKRSSAPIMAARRRRARSRRILTAAVSLSMRSSSCSTRERIASRSEGDRIARARLAASRSSSPSTTFAGSSSSESSGTGPGEVRACRCHSDCTSCQATFVSQFTNPSRRSKPADLCRALRAAVWIASSRVEDGAPRRCRIRRTRTSTWGHASSQVRDESVSDSRNSVTEWRLDLCRGDGERPPLGLPGPAGVVARAPEPCRARLFGSGQLAGHAPERATANAAPSVVEVVPIAGCVQSGGRECPR